MRLAPLIATLLCGWIASAKAAEPEPLLDVAEVCPGIQIELRYATARNITGKPIYPVNARALVLANVAKKLNRAHLTLQKRGFGLKIWDAYRPVSAQRVLWNAIRNPAYVVEPSGVGSLHSWGAAVDVTLVDFGGREVRMPTDFDDFTPAARYAYAGKDPEIAANVKTLAFAMADAGFRHIADEWWHYSVAEGLGERPPEVPLEPPATELAQNEELREPAKLAEPPAATPPPKTQPRPSRPLFPPRPGSTL